MSTKTKSTLNASKRPNTSRPATAKKVLKEDLYPVCKSKIYHVVWRDAYSEMDEWHDYDSLEREDYLCETIGYLIEDNKKDNYFTIASTITRDDFFCCVINIPKSMVVSKKRIVIKK